MWVSKQDINPCEIKPSRIIQEDQSFLFLPYLRFLTIHRGFVKVLNG